MVEFIHGFISVFSFSFPPIDWFLMGKLAGVVLIVAITVIVIIILGVLYHHK